MPHAAAMESQVHHELERGGAPEGMRGAVDRDGAHDRDVDLGTGHLGERSVVLGNTPLTAKKRVVAGRNRRRNISLTASNTVLRIERVTGRQDRGGIGGEIRPCGPIEETM
jgi:hypothetical protein